MKSVKRIRILTYGAMSVVILLQGIWMANAYQLIERQVSFLIRDIFNISVYKELTIRMNVPSSISPQTESNIIFDSAKDDNFSQEIDFNQHISTVLQDHLSTHGKKLSLENLDSIFRTEITKQKLYGKFIINRLNSATGEVLETTDPKGMGALKGAMASEIIPIRADGSEGVQALLISPYLTVFRQMLFALILSLLLIFFVTYALFFMMRSFTKERHLRRLHTDFSHALTHNMASPLHVITNSIDMLSNEKVYCDPEKRAKYIHLSQQQVLNLQAITNQILAIANAEESKLNIQPEILDLSDIIHTLIERFTVQSKKNVHFDTHSSPDKITLQADITLLRDAIGNLIDNAIKYSGENVNIIIRCEQNKTGTFIYIEDNGYGISTKDQNKIFTKFERGKAVKRNQAKGFGLGLSYVKEVVQAHGGSIRVHSDEGKGSEFMIYLPLRVKNNFE